jgi:hypothetical protein
VSGQARRRAIGARGVGPGSHGGGGRAVVVRHHAPADPLPGGSAVCLGQGRGRSRAPRASAAVATDAVPHAPDAAQLLDVPTDQLVRQPALVEGATTPACSATAQRTTSSPTTAGGTPEVCGALALTEHHPAEAWRGIAARFGWGLSKVGKAEQVCPMHCSASC